MKKTKLTESKLKKIIKKALANKINEQRDALDNFENVRAGMIVQDKDTGQEYKITRVDHQFRVASLVSLDDPMANLPDAVKKALGPGWKIKEKVLSVPAPDLSIDYILVSRGKRMNEQETKDQHNYEEFFRTKLKSMYDTEDLGDLSEPERKKFFSAVDHDWKSQEDKMNEQVLPMDDLAYDGYGYDEMEDLEFSDDEMDMFSQTDPDMPPLYGDDELMNEDDENISISDIRALHRDRSKGDVDARERIRGFETEFIELMDKLISNLSPSEIDNVMRQIKRIPMVKRACEEEDSVMEGKRKIRISDLDKIIEKYI
jgi:hypothetical protein